MKRTPTILLALAMLCVASPALAQDDWDDDDGVIGADEFDVPAEEPSTSSSNQGAPLGLAPAEWGIGFRRTLSGAVGPEAEYWFSDKILITGGLALAFLDPDFGMSETDSQLVFLLSGGGFFSLVSGDRAALLAGGRLVVGINTAGATDGVTGESESVTQFNIELPVRTEVFLTKLFSIHFETGISIAFIGEDGPVIPSRGGLLSEDDATSIAIGGTSGLFGAAGITLYWP